MSKAINYSGPIALDEQTAITEATNCARIHQAGWRIVDVRTTCITLGQTRRWKATLVIEPADRVPQEDS